MERGKNGREKEDESKGEGIISAVKKEGSVIIHLIPAHTYLMYL